MKRKNHFLVSIFCLLLVLMIVNQSQAQDTPLKLYGIESGIIEYKYSGSEIGKSILYFDNYAIRSAMKMDTKVEGEDRKGWVISHGEYQYIFDPAKPNEGLKLKNPIIEWIKEESGRDIEKFNEEQLAKLGMKKMGTEVFLGKDCKVYKGADQKMLTWNGMLMLHESNFGGSFSKQEATSIKVNVPVDEKYFEIPKNIKFSEMPMFGTEGYDEAEEDSGDEDEDEE